MVKKKIEMQKKEKKTKKVASKTKKAISAKSKKKKDTSLDDMGIIVIEDDLEVDKDAELEARRAYLEEARSQEASD